MTPTGRRRPPSWRDISGSPHPLTLTLMAATKVFAARLAGLVVLGPDGESIGRLRDIVLSIRYDRQQPRVLGILVELPTRKRIFVPMLRVQVVDPGSLTLTTGNISMRRFVQRPGEMLAVAQILDSSVRVDDPELPQLSDIEVVVVDLGIEQTRTRDWVVTRVAVRERRRLNIGFGRRGAVHVVSWVQVRGLTQTELNLPGQDVTQLLAQFEGMRPADVAHMLRELPNKRRNEVASAFDDERLADVVQELPENDQVQLLAQLGVERAADLLEAMDPDDAADLLGELPINEAESLLSLMDPEDSEPVRRLLEHAPYTAGGLMTPEPVVLTPATTVAEALARIRDPELTPALATMAFVVRPPTSTPTGRYLGCVHFQQLLREPPANLVGGILDTDLVQLRVDAPLATVTRYFATYNLVCGPVVDAENHLLGAVTVDDVLDHLLPDDWREQDDIHDVDGVPLVDGTGSRS